MASEFPRMTPNMRKLILTAHVTSSVGWLGAVAAFLALAIAGLTSPDVQLVRAACLAMNLIAWLVIVPLAFASLFSGVIQSLGTDWGLFRHYWVLTKLLLTLFATVVLLQKMGLIGKVAVAVTGTGLSGADLQQARMALVIHAGGGLLVLLVATVLSVFKPWGRTPLGQRKLRERRSLSPTMPSETQPNQPDSNLANVPSRPDSQINAGMETARSSTGGTRLGRFVLPAIIGLVVLFVTLHLIGIAPVEHQTSTTSAAIYTCIMHPQIHQDQGGKCPICGMELVRSSQLNLLRIVFGVLIGVAGIALVVFLLRRAGIFRQNKTRGP